jgi:chromosome segregation ATPase
MIEAKRTVLSWSLNGFMLGALVALLSTAFVQAAHADQFYSDSEDTQPGLILQRHLQSNEDSSRSAENAKKPLQSSGESVAAPVAPKVKARIWKSSRTAAKAQKSEQDPNKYYDRWCKDSPKYASREVQSKCQEIGDQFFSDYLSKLDLNKENADGVRAHYGALKSRYLELEKRNRELEKRSGDLEKRSGDLEKKNRALARQASQSCSVATQPQNEVKKSVGLGVVPVVGEFGGSPGHGSSGVGQSAE